MKRVFSYSLYRAFGTLLGNWGASWLVHSPRHPQCGGFRGFWEREIRRVNFSTHTYNKRFLHHNIILTAEWYLWSVEILRIPIAVPQKLNKTFKVIKSFFTNPFLFLLTADVVPQTQFSGYGEWLVNSQHILNLVVLEDVTGASPKCILIA